MIDRDALDRDVATLLSENFPVPLGIIEIKEMLQMNGWSGTGLRTRHVIASCRRLARARKASPIKDHRGGFTAWIWRK